MNIEKIMALPSWAPPKKAPEGPGVYIVVHTPTQTVLMIGKTIDLWQVWHRRKPFDFDKNPDCRVFYFQSWDDRELTELHGKLKRLYDKRQIRRPPTDLERLCHQEVMAAAFKRPQLPIRGSG